MTARETSAPSVPSHKQLWIGVLSAPAAWALVEGVGYVVSARECSPSAAADATRVRIVQLAICGIGLLAALYGLRVSLSLHRALEMAAYDRGDPAQGRRRFMAASGVILSVLFIGGIVLFALSALLIDVCERAR